MLALQYGYFGTKCLNLEPEDAAGASPQPGAVRQRILPIFWSMAHTQQLRATAPGCIESNI